MRRDRDGERGPEPAVNPLPPGMAKQRPDYQSAEEDGEHDRMGEAAVATKSGFVTEITEGAAEGVNVGKRRADCRRDPNATWCAARTDY